MSNAQRHDTVRAIRRLIRELQPSRGEANEHRHEAAWQHLTTLVRELEAPEGVARARRMDYDEFLAVAENVNSSLAYLDLEFNFLYANPVYVAGCGHTLDELLGRNHFDLFPNAENQAIFERVRDTGEPAVFRAKPFVFPNQPELGITYWDWTLAPDVDDDGRLRGLVFSLQDVTLQERARLATGRHLERMNRLIDVSKQVLASTTRQGLLQRVVDAARDLTGARLGVSGHGFRDGRFQLAVTSRDDEAPPCPPGDAFAIERGGVHLDLISKVTSLCLTDAELRRHPSWWGLPEEHCPLHGLLGARLTDAQGQGVGLIMLSDKVEGEFDAEDEALLVQLTTIASLGLQHIELRAEAERRADEMTATFAALADAVVVLDAHGAPVRANPAADALFGMDIVHGDRAELARRLDVRDAEGQPVPFDRLPSSRLLRGERVVNERIAFTNGDGDQRIALVSATPLAMGGEPVGGVSIWHDVTEREELMDRLSLEQARLRAIIDNAPLGIVVADTTAEWMLSNPSFRTLARHPQDDASQEQPILCHPDGGAWQWDDQPLTRSALYGEVLRDVEMTLRWPDGARRHLLVNSAPIRDAAARLTGGVAAIQDISERQRAEMALRRYANEQAALYAVSTAIAEWTDPDRLLNTVLEVVLPILDADVGWVLLPGPTPQSPPRVGACRGLPEAFIAATEAAPLAGCVACATLLQDANLDPEPQYAANCARLSREVLQESGLHSHVIIPLRTSERVLGVLNVGWRQPHAYGQAERALARAIGQQVGLALYNAQLYQEARQVDRLRALGELDQELATTLDSAQVRAVALKHLVAALRASTGALLAMASPMAATPDELVTADGGREPRRAEQGDEKAMRALVARARRERDPFLLSGAEVAAALGQAAQPADAWGAFALAIPVQGGDGWLSLSLVGRGAAGRSFGDDDLSLARAAAHRIAQAGESARLYEAVRRQRQQVRALSSRLTEVEEAERQRIARELHDRVGQDLTALSFNLNIVSTLLPPDTQDSIMARLRDATLLVEQTTKDIRNIMSELRPLVLDDYGLVAGLQWYTTEFGRRMGIHVRVEGEEPNPRLGGATETALFRVAQEALTNVVKHAHASHVAISVTPGEGAVRLVVEDDGIGFDPDGVAGPKGDSGWGLLSMTERVAAVGGSCTIESTPGSGTRIVAEVER